MKKQFVILSASLLFVSSVFAAEMKSVSRFNLGESDIGSDCVNENAKLKQRIESFEKTKDLPSDSISYGVRKAYLKKAGRRWGYETCLAEFKSTNVNYAFFVNQSNEQYGENRNLECKKDKDSALTNLSVVGVRTSFDQGWIFNEYCQSFQLFIGPNN